MNSCSKKYYTKIHYLNSENTNLFLWKDSTYSLYNFCNTFIDYDTGKFTKNNDTFFLTSSNIENPRIQFSEFNYSNSNQKYDSIIINLESNYPNENIELITANKKDSIKLKVKTYNRMSKQYIMSKKGLKDVSLKLTGNYPYSKPIIELYSENFEINNKFDSVTIKYNYSFKYFSPLYNRKPIIVKGRNFYPTSAEITF